MKLIATATLILAPGLALASMPCEHELRSELQLELQDIRALQASVGADKLRLVGAPDGDGRLQVRACASSAERLARMALEPERRADGTLRLNRETGGERNIISRSGLFGVASRSDYGWFEVEGRIPDSLEVTITVGSGDAWVHNVAALSGTVGSGDLEVRNVPGAVELQVGSGDIKAHDIGPTRVSAIGSGDVVLEGVRGDLSVGSIGSGDLKARDVEGDVGIGTIGSGDADLQRVSGSVSVRTLGSGDVKAYGIGGDVSLGVKGSGDVRTRDVAGSVDVPRRR